MIEKQAEELNGLVESWLDDACRHREGDSDDVADIYQECAEELSAFLVREGKRKELYPT